ncbi:MAG: hypothetical protein NZ889_00835 [Candidatus Pacearchaeota archaeon]|nr:hypothetical protein [Candidatus Pacearchaeota archaeon]
MKKNLIKNTSKLIVPLALFATTLIEREKVGSTFDSLGNFLTNLFTNQACGAAAFEGQILPNQGILFSFIELLGESRIV